MCWMRSVLAWWNMRGVLLLTCGFELVFALTSSLLLLYVSLIFFLFPCFIRLIASSAPCSGQHHQMLLYLGWNHLGIFYSAVALACISLLSLFLLPQDADIHLRTRHTRKFLHLLAVYCMTCSSLRTSLSNESIFINIGLPMPETLALSTNFIGRALNSRLLSNYLHLRSIVGIWFD